jgi:hypothetical protein
VPAAPAPVTVAVSVPAPLAVSVSVPAPTPVATVSVGAQLNALPVAQQPTPSFMQPAAAARPAVVSVKSASSFTAPVAITPAAGTVLAFFVFILFLEGAHAHYTCISLFLSVFLSVSVCVCVCV